MSLLFKLIYSVILLVGLYVLVDFLGKKIHVDSQNIPTLPTVYRQPNVLQAIHPYNEENITVNAPDPTDQQNPDRVPFISSGVLMYQHLGTEPR